MRDRQSKGKTGTEPGEGPREPGAHKHADVMAMHRPRSGGRSRKRPSPRTEGDINECEEDVRLQHSPKPTTGGASRAGSMVAPAFRSLSFTPDMRDYISPHSGTCSLLLVSNDVDVHPFFADQV
jgi:hypothetical protein